MIESLLATVLSAIRIGFAFLLHPLDSPDSSGWTYPIPATYTHLIWPAILLEVVLLTLLLIVVPHQAMKRGRGILGLAVASWSAGLLVAGALMLTSMATARFDAVRVELIATILLMIVSVAEQLRTTVRRTHSTL